MIRLRLAPLPIAALLAIAANSTWAMDPNCKAAAEALLKGLTVPVHIYSTQTADSLNGKSRTDEMIYLSNASYVLVNGKWRVNPVSAEQLRTTLKEANDGHLKATCRVVREESVNGEAAVLYSTHTEAEDEKSDTQLWISKARGVPIKQEIDLNVGGAAGKSHQSSRYEYTNVQAPAGVH